MLPDHLWVGERVTRQDPVDALEEGVEEEDRPDHTKGIEQKVASCN